MADLQITAVDSSDFSAYDAVVRMAYNPSPYAERNYVRLAGEAFRSAPEFLVVLHRENPIAALPLLPFVGRFGKSLSNRSLWYNNGPLLIPPDSHYPAAATSREVAVLDALARYLLPRFGRIILNIPAPLSDLRALVAHGWRVAPSYTYVWPISDLSRTERAIDKNLRRLIRRAEESGVSYSEDGSAAELYALHDLVHERTGAGHYLPRNEFERFATDLVNSGLGVISVARDSAGCALAAQLALVGSRQAAALLCAGTSEAGRSIGAAPFLRWRSACALHARGVRILDLTDAALNSVTRFKSELGAILTLGLTAAAPQSFAFQLETLLSSIRSARWR